MLISDIYKACDIQFDGNTYLRLNEFYWYQFKDHGLVCVDEKELEIKFKELIKDK